MDYLYADEALLDRMVRAVEKVRERLKKAAAALSAADVPYAIAGGNAVAAWVATIDEAAVRNTQDVDVLLRRADLPQAIAAMEAAGFVYRHSAGLDMFLESPTAKARDAVHVVFAGEKVRPEYEQPAPGVEKTFEKDGAKYLSLEELVTMKLTSYRRKDQVHLEDFLGVGLIDQSWCDKVPPEYVGRLQHLIDTPDG
jgi:hypothetical protein